MYFAGCWSSHVVDSGQLAEVVMWFAPRTWLWGVGAQSVLCCGCGVGELGHSRAPGERAPCVHGARRTSSRPRRRQRCRSPAWGQRARSRAPTLRRQTRSCSRSSSRCIRSGTPTRRHAFGCRRFVWFSVVGGVVAVVAAVCNSFTYSFVCRCRIARARVAACRRRGPTTPQPSGTSPACARTGSSRFRVTSPTSGTTRHCSGQTIRILSACLRFGEFGPMR